MKKYVLLIAILFTAMVGKGQQLNTIKVKPKWAANGGEIYFGNYQDQLLKGEQSVQLVALYFDETRTSTEKMPFSAVEYLFVIIDNKKYFLPLTNFSKGKYTYTLNDYKIVVHYTEKLTATGNGDGGTFYLFKSNQEVLKKHFFSTL